MAILQLHASKHRVSHFSLIPGVVVPAKPFEGEQPSRRAQAVLANRDAGHTGTSDWPDPFCRQHGSARRRCRQQNSGKSVVVTWQVLIILMAINIGGLISYKYWPMGCISRRCRACKQIISNILSFKQTLSHDELLPSRSRTSSSSSSIESRMQ